MNNEVYQLNRKNLKDKLSWRYGGIRGQFERTAEEWQTDIPDAVQYKVCAVCGNNFPLNEPIYMGVFQIAPDEKQYRYRLHTVCKECAYRISDSVIEADGSVHDGMGSSEKV